MSYLHIQAGWYLIDGIVECFNLDEYILGLIPLRLLIHYILLEFIA